MGKLLSSLISRKNGNKFQLNSEFKRTLKISINSLFDDVSHYKKIKLMLTDKKEGKKRERGP